MVLKSVDRGLAKQFVRSGTNGTRLLIARGIKSGGFPVKDDSDRCWLIAQLTPVRRY
jgi:hypothetical protein